ncbi:MAG: hypothetical protein R2819_03525 [Allomuricauda sp.]
MNASALILMIVTVGTITGATIYFFVKVLRTPPNPEPDSYNANDGIEERKE